MHFVFYLVILVAVAIVSTSALDRSRTMRAFGQYVGDFCMTDVFPCTLSGSKCDNQVCTCNQNYEPYASYGSTPDRCTPRNIDLDQGDCELDIDCTTTYGPNAICRTSGTPPYKCTCASGYTKDQKNCVVFDCNSNPSKCNDILSGSTCNTNTGKCVCGQGKLAVGNTCQDLDTYTCDDTTKPCPSALGSVPVKCISGKCVCSTLLTPPSAAAGMSITLIPGSSNVQCSPTSIGGRCLVDNDCPLNALCKGSGGDNKKYCACKPYHKTIPATTSGSLVPKYTCEPALGSCCRTVSECGSSGTPPLICSRVPGSTTGICLCGSNFAWSYSDKKCAAASCVMQPAGIL